MWVCDNAWSEIRVDGGLQSQLRGARFCDLGWMVVGSWLIVIGTSGLGLPIVNWLGVRVLGGLPVEWGELPIMP